MSEWRPIDTLEVSLDSFDLFGWIPYDCFEFRLTDCEFTDGQFWYFQAGEMLKCADLDYTPTHWMPLPQDPQ
jgi:hypothetical protein